MNPIIKLVLLVALFFPACTMRKSPEIISQIPLSEKPDTPLTDPETIQKVEHILNRIKNISERTLLDDLGRSTMGESVSLMDIGEPSALIIAMKLKEPGNWKYRFWMVDMLGYVGGEMNIIPLIEIIEDSSEDIRVRLRACESIKEMKLQQAVPALLISRDIVNDKRILEEINKSIEYLR